MPWRAKTTAPVLINLGTELALAATSGNIGWIGAYVPLLGGMNVSPLDFCKAGPPSDIDFTLDDWQSAAFSTDRFIAKLTRYAEAQVFNTYCEAYAASGEVCTTHGIYSYTNQGGGNHTLVPQVNVGHAFNHVRVNVLSSNTGHIGMSVFVYSASAYLGQLQDLNPNVGTSAEALNTFPTATKFAINYDGNQSVTGSVEVFDCVDNSAPGAYTPPNTAAPAGVPTQFVYPATTDPQVGLALSDLALRIQTLQQQLRDMNAATGGTAVLRTDLVVPLGNDGTADLGSVNGLTIDAVGVLVTVTGIPAWVGSVVAEPTKLVRLGTLTLGRPEGWFQSFTLEHDLTVVIPLPPHTTRVGVKLVPGASATVTPLTA